jgi:hypothetical protein
MGSGFHGDDDGGGVDVDTERVPGTESAHLRPRVFVDAIFLG